MKRRWLRLLLSLFGGSIIVLAEASGRFGWSGSIRGLTFPPETAAQWFFSVIPMNLFELGISLFGKSAKWLAFWSFTVLWVATLGAFLGLIIDRRQSVAVVVAAGLVIEGVWRWVAATLGIGVASPTWSTVALVLVVYAGGFWLVKRGWSV